MFGLLGPNGAGKSTLMRLISNIYYQTRGAVYFNGYKLSTYRTSIQQFIGYLPQKFGLYGNFTPWDYLKLIEEKKVKVHENNTFTGLLEQTIRKRVNGAYLNVAVANYQLEERLKKPNALVFDESLPHTKGNYFMSSIARPQIIKEFNEFLKKEKATVDDLKKKYKVGAE